VVGAKIKATVDQMQMVTLAKCDDMSVLLFQDKPSFVNEKQPNSPAGQLQGGLILPA